MAVHKERYIFFGEVSEPRPWAIKREDRPAVFAGRSELILFLRRDNGSAYTHEYPIPLPTFHRVRE